MIYNITNDRCDLTMYRSHPVYTIELVGFMLEEVHVTGGQHHCVEVIW